MSDSLERLFQAVTAAKDLDPASSRTARLFRRGQAKMAKKLAEEAIEVVIDAVNGKTDAVVRESADLLYNLMVVWVAAGVSPQDVWAEMNRREKLFGIAEKLPKVASKASGKVAGKTSAKTSGKSFTRARQPVARAARSRMVAGTRARKQR
jgi:phosphoribosyl-ATP pyrophosphohydrolase